MKISHWWILFRKFEIFSKSCTITAVIIYRCYPVTPSCSNEQIIILTTHGIITQWSDSGLVTVFYYEFDHELQFTSVFIASGESRNYLVAPSFHVAFTCADLKSLGLCSVIKISDIDFEVTTRRSVAGCVSLASGVLLLTSSLR